MISVALTTCNGIRYLKQQIDSVMQQLGALDELVISDDGSTDGTIELIIQLAEADRRIRWLEGPQQGLVQNFAHALRYCQGDFIFLCDQDDVWLDDKVNHIMAVFANSPKTLLIQHNARFTDEQLKPLERTVFQWRHSRRGIVTNLIKNRYQGCAMVFKRQLLRLVLPFPADIPMHDQWIGLVAELAGKVIFLDEVLMLYRRHSDNLSDTRHSGWQQMLTWRWRLIHELYERWQKIKSE
jgi:GT2 family glycosyltransferase